MRLCIVKSKPLVDDAFKNFSLSLSLPDSTANSHPFHSKLHPAKLLINSYERKRKNTLSLCLSHQTRIRPETKERERETEREREREGGGTTGIPPIRKRDTNYVSGVYLLLSYAATSSLTGFSGVIASCSGLSLSLSSVHLLSGPVN